MRICYMHFGLKVCSLELDTNVKQRGVERASRQGKKSVGRHLNEEGHELALLWRDQHPCTNRECLLRFSSQVRQHL